jgi:hypothetical protein
MVNETAYRYLWAMEKAEEQKLFEKLAKQGAERVAHEAILDAMSERDRESAKEALRQGMKPSRVARALQYTDGYVRKLRKDAKLPPDPRYASLTPPSRRNIGFGSVGIGDTLEEAIANSGPIDTGADLRALVMATPRQRLVDLVERLRRDHAEWYRSMQDVVNTKGGDVTVEILVYALAEGRLSKADFVV